MNQIKIIILLNVLLVSTSLFGQVSEPICIGEKMIFDSKILNQEREIFIKTPENYENTDLDFPVHYVLDGEIIFNSYSAIAELKAQNEEIPEAIIVGIPNIDRGYDLNPKANGVNFLDFITKELIPYIDNKYTTNENRALIGYSMAGNFVIYTLLTGQDLFNIFLSGSPYRLDMYNDELIDSFTRNLKTKKTLYTSIGSSDQAKQLEFFNTFCSQFGQWDNDLLDFKHEVVANRDHDNNFLINWQDGLDYIYRDWTKENDK
ncbi:alpha/beta hydrolase-fold protein [uncultured Draconibacterium sp.]|uniref:alpha/beta hydrolase n=1 Tax=uncultured Draconibacterium sp. TaxID=1573823 RepID=UPI0029C7D46E|nr:alpha/beta hydrolase-fold protein [uncultured Draconibacterium sp.]